MIQLLLTLIFGTALTASAVEVNARFGVGLGSGMHFGSVKYLEAGVSGSVIGPWVYTLAVGGIFDPRPGYASTPLLAGTTGVRASYGPLMASTEWGLAAIGKTDLALSTYYQFTNLSQIAITDQNGHFVGAFYRHLSNAGIKQPNLGRDMLGAVIGVSF